MSVSLPQPKVSGVGTFKTKEEVEKEEAEKAATKAPETTQDKPAK